MRFFFAVLTEAISAQCICRAFVHLPGKEKYRPSRRTIGIFGGGRWISPDGDKLRLHLPRKEKYQSPQKGNWYFWWGKMDSNHRRHCQQIYSLSPLATREHPRVRFTQRGAGGRTRTPDLLITNQLLYRLSYTSAIPATAIIAKPDPFVNKKLLPRPNFFAQATVPALSEYFS